MNLTLLHPAFIWYTDCYNYMILHKGVIMKKTIGLFSLCFIASAFAGEKPDSAKLEEQRNDFLSTGVAGHPGAIAAALQMKWNKQNVAKDTTAPSAPQTPPSNFPVETIQRPPVEKQKPSVADKPFTYEIINPDDLPQTSSNWFWKMLGY